MTGERLIRGVGRQDGSGGSGPVRDMMRGLRRKRGDNGSIPRHFFTEPRDGRLKGLEPIIRAVPGLQAKARRWYLFQCTVVGLS